MTEPIIDVTAEVVTPDERFTQVLADLHTLVERQEESDKTVEKLQTENTELQTRNAGLVTCNNNQMVLLRKPERRLPQSLMADLVALKQFKHDLVSPSAPKWLVDVFDDIVGDFTNVVAKEEQKP